MPRIQNGCDYGQERIVLAQKGDKYIVVIPGHKVWSGVGQPWVYAPTTVTMIGPSGNSSFPFVKDVIEGRTSKAKIAAVADEIAEWFGVEMPAIDSKKTFIWED